MTNIYRPAGDHIVILMNAGAEVLIDPDDLEKVSAYTWAAYQHGPRKDGVERRYVQTMTGGKMKYLHRIVMDAPKGRQVDHLNHNPLDNRKENLRIVTAQENCANREGSYTTSKIGVRGVSVQKRQPSGLLYAFRCHCKGCKTAKYFPHTEDGLAAACNYSVEHHNARK